MKKLTMITSLCAAAAVVWSVSASARVFEAHDKMLVYDRNASTPTPTTTAPEPATLGLLALGLSGLGLARRRRRKD